MKSLLFSIAVSCTLIVSTTSCFDAEEIGGMINEIKKDQEKAALFADTLKQQYDAVEVSAILLDKNLKVIFFNSPLMRLNDDQRDSLAKEIGVHARNYFGTSEVLSGDFAFALVGDVEMEEEHLEPKTYPLFNERARVVGGFGAGAPDEGDGFEGDTLGAAPVLRLEGDSVEGPITE